MRDEIHGAALRAAAKVALTMSTAAIFAGCSREGNTDTKLVKADPQATDAAPAAPSVSAVTIEKTACLAGDGKAPTAKELDCCVAKAKNAFPQDVAVSAATGAGDAGVLSEPTLVACCSAILNATVTGTQMDLTYEQERACCHTQGPQWWQHPACTPWGPPMPPEMAVG